MTNLITAAADSIIAAIVIKIATPPPRGMTLCPNLSALSLETKPTFNAHFPIKAVRIDDNKKEPTTRPDAIRIIFSISTAPRDDF
jgi:hypothetical protein